MLLRMADVISNGLNGCDRLAKEATSAASDQGLSLHFEDSDSPAVSTPNVGASSSFSDTSSSLITAAELCKNLVQFSHQLSAFVFIN